MRNTSDDEVTNVRGQVDADLKATKARFPFPGPKGFREKILCVALPFGAIATNGLQPTGFHSCLVLSSLHEFYSRVSCFFATFRYIKQSLFDLMERMAQHSMFAADFSLGQSRGNKTWYLLDKRCERWDTRRKRWRVKR